MKRSFLAAAVSLLMLITGTPVYAEDTAQEEYIQIQADMTDMPSGTAYVDILGRISPESEYYTSFNGTAPELRTDGKSAYADIDLSSPIVLYDTDGYMSLSAHLKGASLVTDTSGSTYMDGTLLINADGMTAETVYKKFGRFRAAYVSGSGEVLGVTDTAVSALTKENIHILKVDGSSAVYEFKSDSADNAKKLQDPVGLLSMGVFVMFFIMLIALGIIVIRNIWRFIKQMRKK